MSYGIKIYNDSGFLTIDDTYKNYMLHQSGTASISSANFAVTFPSLGSEIPVVFIRTSNTTNWIKCTVRSDRIILNAFNSAGTGTVTGVSVQYAVFKKTPTASTEAYGLRVYSADGTISFDSGRRYPRVAEVLNIHPWSGTTASSRVITHSAISTPWYQVMQDMLHIVPFEEDYSDIWYLVFRHKSTTSFEVASLRYNDGGMYSYPAWTGIARPPDVTFPSNAAYLGAILTGSY